jgi:hypothetical protein
MSTGTRLNLCFDCGNLGPWRASSNRSGTRGPIVKLRLTLFRTVDRLSFTQEQNR